MQSVMLGTSPMPLTSKNKYELVKIPKHFNVYKPEIFNKMPIGVSSLLGQRHRLLMHSEMLINTTLGALLQNV